MKKLAILFFLTLVTSVSAVNPPIYIAFQWHMHQPIYVPGETVIQTQNSGKLSYNLYDVFTSRTGPYTTYPTSAVNKLIAAGFAHAGAQVSFSGSLIENLNTLESNNIAFSGWKSNWTNLISQKTSLGNQRLDMVAFGYFHPLMPLTDIADIRKQIQKHKAAFAANFPGMPYSKGIFPPENAFEERIIPALVAEGIEWVMVDNSHFDRACAGVPWVKETSIVEPNKADQINPNPGDWKKLTDMYAPGSISAAWGHRPHWMKQVDPQTGIEYKMIAVPTSLLFGNEDGRGGFGALQYDKCISQLESYNTDPAHPILLVLHHDGDNYGGGSSGYYGSNFDNFITWLSANPTRFQCTTIQDYLAQFPPATDDIIHVEAGSWYGAGADPEFLKWNGDPGTYTLNGVKKSDNYSPDRNSWGVITATSNIVKTAEQINATSADTKVAWDYLTMGETSCYWYWDGTEDWDSHPTRASNMATARAINVINSGNDLTPPSIYHPQREPYNPGATEWNIAKPSDFTVWSYVFDISGLSSVKLKYRTDLDGVNPLSNNQNETYTGGNEVSGWVELPMPPTTITNLTSLAPTYKADEYSAQITGLKNVLVDYYIEAIDSKGNIARSPISEVWVGANSGNTGSTTTPSTNTGTYNITPIHPSINDIITVELPNATSGAVFHWGINKFEKPNAAYLPSGSTYHTDNKAARTPFYLNSTGKYEVKIGPFNNSIQPVQYISFVVNYTGNNSWDNNSGTDYQIALNQLSSSVNTISDKSFHVFPNPATESIHIQSNLPIESSTLLNYQGETVKTVGNNPDLNISDLNTGIYLLKITFSNHTQTTQKIVKNK